MYRCCKSFVGLKTGHKRIYIVTYHAEIILGDQAVWPGAVPSDVWWSDLVNKHIKRAIKKFDWLPFKFNSLQIKSNLNQDSCFQRCVYNLKYIRSVKSDDLLCTTQYKKLDPHNCMVATYRISLLFFSTTFGMIDCITESNIVITIFEKSSPLMIEHVAKMHKMSKNYDFSSNLLLDNHPKTNNYHILVNLHLMDVSC